MDNQQNQQGSANPPQSQPIQPQPELAASSSEGAAIPANPSRKIEIDREAALRTIREVLAGPEWSYKLSGAHERIAGGHLPLSGVPSAPAVTHTPERPALGLGMYGLQAHYIVPCSGDQTCTGLLARADGPIGRPQWSSVRCPHHGHIVVRLAAEHGWHKRVQIAHIPAHYLELVTTGAWPGPLAESPSGEVFQVAQAAAAAENTDSMLLMGPHGIGKTAIATWLFYERVRYRGERGLWASVPDLLESLRPGPTQDQALLGRAKSCDILLLDDLGAEKPSAWTSDILFQVIGYRYDHLRATIVTSNLPLYNVVAGPGEALDLPEGSYPPGTLEAHCGKRLCNRLMDPMVYLMLYWQSDNLRLGPVIPSRES